MAARRPNPNVNAGKDRSHAGVANRRDQPEPERVALPLALEQSILDVFRHAFPFEDVTKLRSTIQEVKGHLYDRDFASAFSKPEYLTAYALRWSASRALCYTDIFTNLDHWPRGQQPPGTPATRDENESAAKFVCIGGGAGAEMVALAAAIHASNNTVILTAVDIADWSSTLKELEHALKTPPPVSAYASSAVRTSNAPMVAAGRLSLNFVYQDILEYRDEALTDLMLGAGFCTIMFTLNELFSSSIAKTTAFLLSIGEAMRVGSSLLVVDSPGSYSEVRLGVKSKQYPMKWLLDHTLMEVAKGKWIKIMEDDSRWFRVNGSVKFPIDLENMRYQIHLYQRTEGDGEKVY